MSMISANGEEISSVTRKYDTIVKVENVEFHVHKAVLRACDPFFDKFFLKSSGTECTVVRIEDVSHEIMSQIIEFAYTGSVSPTDVFKLFNAAYRLNMTRIGKTCFNLLKDKICPETCIRLWHLTKTKQFVNLQREVFHFICGHFEEVALSDGFLQLSVQELADFLDRDDLNVSQESTVYESILRWIKHRPEERQQNFASLLPKVRLGLMDKDYLRLNVLTNDLVRTNREFNLMVLQVTRYQSRINNTLFRPRLQNAVLLAVGGWSSNHLPDVVEAYDYRANCWIGVQMCVPVPGVCHHGTAFLGASVYIVGGGQVVNAELLISNKVHRFNTETHTWQEVRPMHQPRCFVSATVLNGCIYAIGGFDKGVSLSSAECYQPDIDRWKLIASMNDQRSRASCTTLNNKIFICGGYNMSRDLETAECYNQDTNQWTRITPMGAPRRGLGVIAYVDHIFAVGGCNGFMYVKSAEAYNPLTETWHNIPEMLQSHCYFGIAVINELLFVVSDSSQVECFNSKTNSWSEVCSMKNNRIGLSCCVISGLPNMADYCTPCDPVPH